MDPLSITASIISILAVAKGVDQGLQKLQSLREVPDVILALNNEVSDLKLSCKKSIRFCWIRVNSPTMRKSYARKPTWV